MSMLTFLTKIFGSNIPEPPTSISSDSEHDRAYTIGVELINPYMHLHGNSHRALSRKEQKHLAAGIRFVEAASRYKPQAYSHHWIIGKAHQAQGHHDLAYAAFRRSHELNPTQHDVARELMHSCMELHKHDEALELSQIAVANSPDDAGLHANLALALLLNGLNTDAQQAIARSLQIDPDDTISKNLAVIIAQVVAGSRPQPESIHNI